MNFSGFFKKRMLQTTAVETRLDVAVINHRMAHAQLRDAIDKVSTAIASAQKAYSPERLRVSPAALSSSYYPHTVLALSRPRSRH
jgi:hypothetical protein